MGKDCFRRALIALAVTAVLLWIPFTRRIVLWILPLGRGIDDAIMFACMIAAGVFGIFYYIRKRREL